jgi:putative flippase GtrA
VAIRGGRGREHDSAIVVASALLEAGGYAAGEANGIAFMVATLASYWLNTILTFAAPLRFGSFLRFALVATIGLILTVAIASAIEGAGYHYLIGIGLVVTIVPALTFVLHVVWTYRVRFSVK